MIAIGLCTSVEKSVEGYCSSSKDIDYLLGVVKQSK